MKSTLISLSLLCVFSSYAQEKSEQLRIDSIGIKVYQAVGVEDSALSTDQPTMPESNPVRNVNDWDIEECENALYHLRNKINLLIEEDGKVEAIELYKIQAAELEQRKQQLINR